jgi:hypothetical protein
MNTLGVSCGITLGTGVLVCFLAAL